MPNLNEFFLFLPLFFAGWQFSLFYVIYFGLHVYLVLQSATSTVTFTPFPADFPALVFMSLWILSIFYYLVSDHA
jgi:hypothetical protein